MFGKKSYRELIFFKAKNWWELLHKLHLPEERKKLSPEQLVDVAKELTNLRSVIRNLELQNKVPLEKMVDFEKLTRAFFRINNYEYGEPIAKEKQESIEKS